MLLGEVSRFPESSSAALVPSETLPACWFALIMKSTRLSASQNTMKPSTPATTFFQVIRRHQGSRGTARRGSGG